MGGRGSRGPARILLAVAALGLALFVAEAAVRLTLPSWRPGAGERSDFWSYDPLLGWAQRPGTEGRFVGPGWDVEVRINSKGLRDVEHAHGAGDRHRILVLGDSFGWGYGVSQEEGVVARLRDLCSDSEIINASVSGYGTDQEYLYFESEGHRYEPDTVLLLVYGNDMVEDSCSTMYGYPKPRFVPGDGELILENVPVPPRPRLARIYGWLSASSWLASRALLVTGWAHRLDVGCHEFDGKVTQMILVRFTRELREKDVEFRWVLIPEKPGRRTFQAKFYHLLADREEVPLLDLARPLAEAAAGGASLTLPENAHWNAKGHRVAAEAIAEDLGCH